MSELESLDAGRRHHLGAGFPPGAPEDRHLPDETNGAFGSVHSYETASRCDGPGFGSCCSSRDARFAVLIATIPIAGI
jgi:hypothetical protein